VNTTPGEYTIVALKMVHATALDAIVGSTSAAGVLGAPSSSGFLPTPTGRWTATSSFYALSASDCASLNLTFMPPNAYYATAIVSAPAAYTIPTDATLLGSIPLDGYDSSAIQQTLLMSFASATSIGTSTVALAANACVVVFHNVATPNSGMNCVLDFENQSSAYFHLTP